jgi:copper transport protein
MFTHDPRLSMFLRRPFRLLGGALLAISGVLAAAGPAWAHADLETTEPEYGAVLLTGPDRAVARYDRPVEVNGAQVTLRQSGRRLRVGRPVFASPDHTAVALPLPELTPGSYVLTWFLFGPDGDVMGAELPFRVGGGASPTAAGPALPSAGAAAGYGAFAPLGRAQDAARLVSFGSFAVLVGGVVFLARLWWPGAALRRTWVLLWGALATALLSNAAAFGLKGAAVSGRTALGLFSPSAWEAIAGTHVGRVLAARLGFLVLVVAFLAYLWAAPHRALQSEQWSFGAGGSALGIFWTHGQLSHASNQGWLASATDVVHLGAVAVWLGGLVMLAVVLLPRREWSELATVVPGWSRLAFGAMTTALLAGGAVLVLLSPRWTALPGSSYGRFLMVKLLLVAGLLFVASRARNYVGRGLPAAIGPSTRSPAPSTDVVALAPFVTAVTAELCIAASVLAAAAALVGRAPPP